MIKRDHNWPIPAYCNAFTLDNSAHQQLKRLAKIQKYLSPMNIEKDINTSLPVGVVNLSTSQHPNSSFDTTVSVRLGRNEVDDQAEFCTKLADLPAKEDWKGLLDGLNRNADGKFVALNSDESVTILLTSQKPVDWIDSVRVTKELEYHAGTRLLFLALLERGEKASADQAGTETQRSEDNYQVQWFASATRTSAEPYQIQAGASLERLKQLQSIWPDIDIVANDIVSGPFGVVDSDIRSGSEQKPVRVTIKVSRMGNHAQQQAEFSTTVGTVPSPDMALSCVHSLNRIMDGKFIAEEGIKPNTKDIVYVSAKPATWIDRGKLERELEIHCTAKAALEPVLTQLSTEWHTRKVNNEVFTYSLITCLDSNFRTTLNGDQLPRDSRSVFQEFKQDKGEK